MLRAMQLLYEEPKGAWRFSFPPRAFGKRNSVTGIQPPKSLGDDPSRPVTPGGFGVKQAHLAQQRARRSMVSNAWKNNRLGGLTERERRRPPGGSVGTYKDVIR